MESGESFLQQLALKDVRWRSLLCQYGALQKLRTKPAGGARHLGAAMAGFVGQPHRLPWEALVRWPLARTARCGRDNTREAPAGCCHRQEPVLNQRIPFLWKQDFPYFSCQGQWLRKETGKSVNLSLMQSPHLQTGNELSLLWMSLKEEEEKKSRIAFGGSLVG